MTIDEGYVSTSELMRRTEEQDRALYLADLEERDACESVEEREAYFEGRRRAMPPWMRDVHYDSGPG